MLKNRKIVVAILLVVKRSIMQIEDRARATDPNYLMGYSKSYGVAGGKKEEVGEIFRAMAFVFPRNHYVWRALLSWE